MRANATCCSGERRRALPTRSTLDALPYTGPVIRLSLFLLLAAFPAAFAQNFPLVIVEKKAGAVGFYTPEGKRVAGVKVGEHPHEIVLSPDKKLGN